MKNEKIVSALDCVVLSEEASQRIYCNITAENTVPRRTVSKRFVAVIAAAMVIVLAAGTVFAEAIIPKLITVKEEYTIVTMDGEIITNTIEYETYDVVPEPVYDYDWLVENSSLTKLTIESDAPYCAGFYGLSTRADGDYEKLESLIPDDGILKLPGDIPQGFELESALVKLYMTEEDAVGAVKAEETFVSDGVIYQCYQMPDSITDNIEYVGAEFKNSEGDIIRFHGAVVDVIGGIGAESDVKVEILEIEGFDKAVCLTDSKKTYCSAIRYIEPIEVVSWDLLGNEERAEIHGVEARIVGGYKLCVESYSVHSETVGAEELIKILESLA